MKSENGKKNLPEEKVGLPQLLKEKRLAKNVSLERLSDLTKIQAYHLEALENGQFEKLPPAVYRAGIFKRLAKFLDADAGEIMKMYEEKNRPEEIPASSKPSIFRKHPFFILTPRMITFALGGLFLITVASYLWYQFDFLIGPPTLAVEPKEDMITKNETVSLTGKTDSRVDLTINGENIFVASNGSFSKEIRLIDGVNTIEIKAVNSFGKTNKIIRQVLKEQ